MIGPPGRNRTATDRILRVFALFTGGGYLIYLLMLLPSIVDQSGRFAQWWTPLVVIGVFGSGFAFGFCALAPRIELLQICGAAAAITYLLAVASGMATWHGPAVDTAQGAWLSTFPGVASLAAAAAWRPAIAFGHMVVACISVQILNYMIIEPSVRNPLVPSICFAIMFCTLFVGAAVMALRTGRLLDATLDSTYTAAAEAAAGRARTVERARFDALIHDGVMSTLLVASRQGITESLSLQAGRTLRQLDALRSGPQSDERFDIAEVVTHLRTAAGDVDDGIGLVIRRLPGCEAFVMPAEATRAMGAAMAEATRNSIKHAGAQADRMVTVTVEPRQLTVVIDDDGIGFDRGSVPAHRLGVAVSIIGRMNQLAGGCARIDSKPGRGTSVRLVWSEP